LIPFFRSVFASPRHFILLLAALWVGLALAEKRSERHNISRDVLSNLVYYGVFSYILGGRLLYALSNFPAFAKSPLSIFSLNIDLFDPVAALAAAVIVGSLFGYRQKLPLWSTLDALTPLLAMLAVGLSLSHLAAGTAFGSPTELPWGIELWNATRHPTQIYGLIASILIFSLLWFRPAASPAGSDFLLFTALSAGACLFLEAFRGDSTLVLGQLRLSQVIAWFVLAGTFVALERLRTVEKTQDKESASPA